MTATGAYFGTGGRGARGGPAGRPDNPFKTVLRRWDTVKFSDNTEKDLAMGYCKEILAFDPFAAKLNHFLGSTTARRYGSQYFQD